MESPMSDANTSSSASTPVSVPTRAPIPLIDLVKQFEGQRDEILETVSRVFCEQKFILGDEVAKLEEETGNYCDSRFSIGCASGTDALILALMAIDLPKGGEVITSPFTFFATGSSIWRTGGKPVFVDIEPGSFNMDPAAVAAAVTPRTKALMPVHIFGQTCEMDPLWRLATRHDLAIIEDACQSIGAEYRGRRAGVLGTIGCFSFFPTKNLGGAGDAGLMTTDDEDIAKRLKRLRVHGDIGVYEHLEVGLNSRIDALQAAVLRIKLRKLDDWTRARQRNAKRYSILFDEYGLTDVLTAPPVQPDRRHVFNQYCVRVADGKRDEVLKSLRAQQIGCGVYYPKPLHLQTCFAELGYKAGMLPVAEQACKEVLALPIFPELTEAQQEEVVKGLCRAFGRETKRRLQSVLPRPKFLGAEERVTTDEGLAQGWKAA
jgi:dTDP-4-amino-4,6-dideoxygalactose transaminase